MTTAPAKPNMTTCGAISAPALRRHVDEDLTPAARSDMQPCTLFVVERLEDGTRMPHVFLGSTVLAPVARACLLQAARGPSEIREVERLDHIPTSADVFERPMGVLRARRKPVLADGREGVHTWCAWLVNQEENALFWVTRDARLDIGVFLRRLAATSVSSRGECMRFWIHEDTPAWTSGCIEWGTTMRFLFYRAAPIRNGAVAYKVGARRCAS